MVQSFGKTSGEGAKDPHPLVGLDDERKFIHFVFEEFLRAKGSGFDTKIIRMILRLRKKDKAERQEEEALLDVYKSALGME